MHAASVCGGSSRCQYRTVERAAASHLDDDLAEVLRGFEVFVRLGRRIEVEGFVDDGREHFDALMKAVAVNELKPVVDKTFGFDEAPEAFKYLKSAQHFGKVVIKI